MSTRSRIGVMDESGVIVSAYCHWDGYPGHNGSILYKFYSDPRQAKLLIINGAMSKLGEVIGKKHDFSGGDANECTFYYRDRDEELVIENHKNINSFINEGMEAWEEFLYLNVNGVWYVYGHDYKVFTLLNDVLYKEHLEASINAAFYRGLSFEGRITFIDELLNNNFEKDIQKRVDKFLKGEYNKKNGDDAKPKKENTTMATKKTVSTANEISRFKLEGFLRSQVGRFLTVEFIKKNGENRVLNGQVDNRVDGTASTLDKPYIVIRDMKAKSDADDGYRNVNLSTVLSVKVNGITYKVK